MKTSWLRVLGVLVWTVGIGLGLMSGCGREDAGGDNSETHFLSRCTDTCGGGLECICGVCTKKCTAESACGALDPSATCEDSCGASATKICDMACKVEGDCKSLGGDFSCQAGYCRTGGASGVGGAGVGGAGQGGSPEGLAGAAGAAAPSACQAEPAANPKVPAVADLDPEKVARAAVVIGSCWPDDGIDRNAGYLWSSPYSPRRFYYQNAAQLDCLADANCGCDGVKRCLGYTDSLSAPPDCSTSCDGDVLRACGGGHDLAPSEIVTVDCGKLGYKCDTQLICAQPDSQPCPDKNTGTCRPGQRALFCNEAGGTEEGPDCAALGLGCNAGSCQGTGTACTNNDFYPDSAQVVVEGVSCTDGKLEACVYGKTQTMDCGALGPGFTCQMAGGKPFCGLASDCLPAGLGSGSATNPVSCDGTKVTFCSAGRLETLDCLSLGFTGCSIDKKMGGYGCTPSALTL